MIYITGKEEKIVDGVAHITETYSDGSTIEYTEERRAPDPPAPPDDGLLDEGEAAMAEMQANIQYLVDMAMMNEGGTI